MAGIKNSPFNGSPLIYRESQYAAKHFKVGTNNGKFTNNAIIPKPKFLFFVKFIRSIDAATQQIGATFQDANRLSDPNFGIVFQIKQIDKPRFNVKAETLHQYNKKRVIQTKIEYQPMTINFHDDVSDRVLKFWAEYYRYYYGEGRQITSSDWRDDIVKADFDEGSAGAGWGYKGRFNGLADSTNFLERIELYQFYGNNYTIISFVHPKITAFDHDSNDYADGREGLGIRMTFDYEGVIYDLEPKTINVNDPEFEEFGFSNDYYDITGTTPSEFTSSSGNQPIRNPYGDITRFNEPIDENINLAQAISTEAKRDIFAGSTALGNTGFTFGTGAFTNQTGNVFDLRQLTSFAGGTPSPDLVQKASGIKQTVDTFGRTNTGASSPITSNPRIVNSGIDSVKVESAASVLNTTVQNNEEYVAPGQTKFVDRSEIGEFSRTLGTAAAVAQNEGLITGVAKDVKQIGAGDAENKTLVNKVPNGNYQLTESGAAVLNSLRSPDSFVGSRKIDNIWKNPNQVDVNRRALAAEKNDNGIVT